MDYRQHHYSPCMRAVAGAEEREACCANESDGGGLPLIYEQTFDSMCGSEKYFLSQLEPRIDILDSVSPRLLKTIPRIIRLFTSPPKASGMRVFSSA
jgi:hypothetical protein